MAINNLVNQNVYVGTHGSGFSTINGTGPLYGESSLCSINPYNNNVRDYMGNSVGTLHDSYNGPSIIKKY